MTYTTEQIVQAVENDPQRWQQVTRESALSLPVPLPFNGQLWLAFFWYPVGGPAMNRVVMPPTHRALASTLTLTDIFFSPLQPQDFGLAVAPGTPLGKPTIGGSVLSAEMKEARQLLYTLTDAVMPCYGKPVSSLSDSEQQTIATWQTQFERLAVVVLRPAYRSLNPDFFAWIESVRRP